MKTTLRRRLLLIAGVMCAAIFAIAGFKDKQKSYPHADRPDVCLTMVMMTRMIDENGFGDWHHDYTEEYSIKASGDYAKRINYPNGRAELVVAEKGESTRYILNSEQPAVARAFESVNSFLDEKWLATHANLRREMPNVTIQGYRTYVLRYGNTGGSYNDMFISPELGQMIMSYHHSTQTNGIQESLYSPVHIRVGSIRQDLWDAVPKNVSIVRQNKRK